MADTIQQGVQGRDHTVRELFGKQYVLEYYQREYTWERRHVVELVNDLATAFLRDWQTDHDRLRYVNYRPYFLGPFVCHPTGVKKNLVDGQQRFTTLHLLLIHIERLLIEQGDVDTANMVGGLIRRYAGGQHHYTIDVEERRECLEALRAGRDYDPTGTTVSVQNLWHRAQDISGALPEALRDECLPIFADWLADRVSFVEISAADRDLGWEIFETMNDRGARLTSLDLLKSFLLSRAGREQAQLDVVWRKMLSDLSEFDDRQVPTDFFETLLLARYAAADGSESEEISRAFHEWVRKSPDRVGLKFQGQDYCDFVRNVVVPSSGQYCQLLKAAKSRKLGLEEVFYNAANGIDAQYLLIMAAVREDDAQNDFQQKAKLLASYLDLVYIIRTVNNDGAVQSQDFLTEVYRLIPVVREASSVEELRKLLGREAAALPSFSAVRKLSLHNNRRQIRYLLARITAFVEAECGRPDLADAYIGRGIDGLETPWEIEHIWANKYSLHIQTGVANERDFQAARNRVGALLLLDKSDNASFGADRYVDKLPIYFSQNLLAASLNPACYKRKPKFRKFREKYGLEDLLSPFPGNFDTHAIDSRAELYQRLSELIWDSERLGFVKVKTLQQGVGKTAQRRKTHYGIQVSDLMRSGLVTEGTTLQGELKRTSQKFRATIQAKGRIRVESGEEFGSLSGAGAAVQGLGSCAGWDFWHIIDAQGQRVSMASIRKIAIAQGLLEQNEKSSREGGQSLPVGPVPDLGSQLETFNQKHETVLAEADLAPLIRLPMASAKIKAAAHRTDLENFADVFDRVFQAGVEDWAMANPAFLKKFMDEEELRSELTGISRSYAYVLLRRG
ncbi:GmrSD restriction endonuclease domain-containing protein [Streptomyces goshikiensis]|uniref:GmrSD restriction endonuclease domain-containing protein n=1 Tax=Streptomyces goshikiensis TaxID=1942 RepID=UPI0036CD19E6